MRGYNEGITMLEMNDDVVVPSGWDGFLGQGK